MKVTQYITANNSFLKPYTVKPTGGEMGGVPVIEVKDAPLRDKVTGFGVAVTGSSCYELNSMPEQQRKEFLEDIYGDNGLGLSVGRISIGSSDYSSELYSYDDIENDVNLEHFSAERDEAYIIPMIREVIKVRPDIMLFASPWSPPGWMKTGGSMCGGYMREQYIDCYADYIIKFLKAYKEKGIDISALTPQNEPETTQNGCMPACIWHPDIEAKFISVLRKKLDKENMSTEIWMHDHNFSNWQRVLWMFREYPELLNDCDGIAFHYYSGAVEMLENIRREIPSAKFHFTEGGPRLYDRYDTDWCKWSIMMAKALNNGCRSFTGWNLLLDETGGPNIGPFFCGGLATLNSSTGELTYSGQYRAFGHFSKFIKRGAEVYSSNINSDYRPMFAYGSSWEPIEVCAVKNPDGTFVLELVNPNSSKRQVQYFRDNKWWYFELLPESVSTVVFE